MRPAIIPIGALFALGIVVVVPTQVLAGMDVTTEPATDIIQNGARLHVSWTYEDCNGTNYEAWFQYGEDPALGEYNETPHQNTGADSSHQYFVNGLTFGTHYFRGLVDKYCLTELNESGVGGIFSFTLSDADAPTTTASVDGTLGDAGWFISPATITLTATDNDEVNSTYHRVNGGQWQVGTNLTLAGEGVFTVGYYSDDLTGNVESVRNVSVWVDFSPPTTTLDVEGASGENGWFVSPVSVSLFASDIASGLRLTEVRLNGSAWVEYNEPLALGDGRHIVEFRSTDYAGWVEDVQLRSVLVDTELPVIEIAEPLSQATLDKNTVTVVGFSDDDEGVRKVEIRVDGGNWILMEETRLWSHTITLDNGTHAVEAKVTDLAGQTATDSVTFTIQVLSPPPPEEPPTEDPPTGDQPAELGGGDRVYQTGALLAAGAGVGVMGATGVYLLMIRRKK